MYNERLSNIISEQEFEYMQDYAQEFMSDFLTNKVFLHKVDKQKTNSSQNFDEALQGEIFFLDPLEIPCIVEIKPQTNKAYSENKTARYEEYGNLIFYCLESSLRQRKIDVDYGDYISYEIKKDFVYFEVVNNDTKNISNDKTFIGYEPMWKVIECTSVNQNKIMKN